MLAHDVNSPGKPSSFSTALHASFFQLKQFVYRSRCQVRRKGCMPRASLSKVDKHELNCARQWLVQEETVRQVVSNVGFTCNVCLQILFTSLHVLRTCQHAMLRHPVRSGPCGFFAMLNFEDSRLCRRSACRELLSGKERIRMVLPASRNAL